MAENQNENMNELDLDMMDRVVGGAYNVDESKPEVQALIKECRDFRKFCLANNWNLQSRAHMIHFFDFCTQNRYRMAISDWDIMDVYTKYFLNDGQFPE